MQCLVTCLCVILNILYILCSVNSSGLSYVYLLECLSSEPSLCFIHYFVKPPTHVSDHLVGFLSFPATVECGIAGVAGRPVVC